MDGETIKNEYVRCAISLTRLEQKHGLQPGTLAQQAREEGWQEARRAHRRAQKEKNLGCKRLEKLLAVSDRLLDKLSSMVDAIDPAAFPCQSLRHLSGTLKDIKDLQMLRSEADIREQEAKIESLRQKLSGNEEKQITVMLDGGAGGYAE